MSEEAQATRAYTSAGVDAASAGRAIDALVEVLQTIDPGRDRRSLIGTGHYASVVALDESTAIAICTDGVGSKLIVAEQSGRFDTVGIDCVAMNVNDLVCVGAEPLALVDYIAVEQADAEVLRAIGRGLKRGAELARVEIPGGELAQLPEMIRGHPSPSGLDLVGAAFGVVRREHIVSGRDIEAGDVVIGMPSSGIHSNGFTLARRALLEQAGHALGDAPEALGRTLAEELLEPTEIYVQAILQLLSSEIAVRGLAHITGDGLLNLRRLNGGVGYEIADPLPHHPIFGLIQAAGGISNEEMHTVFNMGTGFCCVVAPRDADAAGKLLTEHHPGARPIGFVTSTAGEVRVPASGIAAAPGAGFGPA